MNLYEVTLNTSLTTLSSKIITFNLSVTDVGELSNINIYQLIIGFN